LLAAVDPPKHRRSPPWRRRPSRRALALAALLLASLLGAPPLIKFFVAEQIGNQVNRVPDVFAPLEDAARPPLTGALTFLLVGTDTRSDAPTTGTGADGDGLGRDRSDVIMLARVDAARTGATIVSIPRDSWVDIPGLGRSKINSAYATGGPSLLVQTVEGLTGLRVDHLAVIDFAGFQALVDAVDGIDVATGTGPIVSHLNGEAALKFVRQRQAQPLGDLDRVRQEQMALRALLVKTMSNGALTDPGGLYRLLDAARTSVGVDDTLTNGRLRAVAAELRKVQPTAVRFVQAPIERWGSEGSQPVAYLAPYATELWSALRSDTLDNYLYQHSTG